jgi:TPR repeat protein
VIKYFFLAVIWFLIIPSSQAKNYVRDYTYTASEVDSKVTSRIIALDQVKIILLQEIGTHIRQKMNITKNHTGVVYAQEDVEAITAGLTKVEILEEKWNGKTYYLKAKIEADTDKVLNALDEFKKANVGFLQQEQDLKRRVEDQKKMQLQLKFARKEIDDLKVKLMESETDKEKATVGEQINQEVDKIFFSQQLNEARNLILNDKYIEAKNIYKKLAESENAEAQYQLGYIYLTGYGSLKIDFKKAFLWFLKSANQDHSEGQYRIGRSYFKGYGVDKNQTEALKWFTKAANNGNFYAPFDLGKMYYKGLGTEKDYKVAFQLFSKGADLGNFGAINFLSYMYLNGLGVDKDAKKAFYWKTKEALGGGDQAQNELGVMYQNGIGIEIDYSKAEYWIRKAAESYNEHALYNLGFIYENGLGVKKNTTVANKYFKKSCDRGYRKACDSF